MVTLKMTVKELTSPAVAKMHFNENESLKKSLKEVQDSNERLNTDINELKTENAVLKEKMNIHLLIEIWKFLCSASIWFFSGLLTGNFSWRHLWRLILCLALWIVLMCVQSNRSKKVST